MYITVIGQAVLELLNFKIGSLNPVSSEIFVNMRLISTKMTSCHYFQVLEIEVFSKPCKI